MKPAPETSRCTGGCCRSFPLPLGVTKERLQADPRSFEDGEMVADMLVPLGREEVDGHPLYTCKHLDYVTGDCTVYDRRPAMCREFPYGLRCPIVGCTMKPNPPQQSRAALRHP